jgi:phage N-6-adenine-methyltransferase
MSRQDYETPDDFFELVQKKFCVKFTWDLAASKANTKCEKFLSRKDDSLSMNWNALRGNLWLNPPFENIRPWAKKCSETKLHGWNNIFLLVPASVGTDWFIRYVYNFASVHPLFPRIAFKGQTQGINRDMMLCIYGRGEKSFSPWVWKKK